MLEELKILLGFNKDEPNTERDRRLQLILDNTRARLKLRLGGIEPPLELNHIILEASINRYNRIGSEGVKSHDVEGERMEFKEDIFSEFDLEIQAFLDKQKKKQGRVRFL